MLTEDSERYDYTKQFCLLYISLENLVCLSYNQLESSKVTVAGKGIRINLTIAFHQKVFDRHGSCLL